MENDIGRQYVSNYCPKLKKLNPSPPKPLNIDKGQSLLSNGTVESPKKSGARATLLLLHLANLNWCLVVTPGYEWSDCHALFYLNFVSFMDKFDSEVAKLITPKPTPTWFS